MTIILFQSWHYTHQKEGSLYQYLVVSGNIFVEGTEHDHRHHSRQEEHDDKRVEDAEPLDISVRHGVQDVVPTRRPADVSVTFLCVEDKCCKMRSLSCPCPIFYLRSNGLGSQQEWQTTYDSTAIKK